MRTDLVMVWSGYVSLEKELTGNAVSDVTVVIPTCDRDDLLRRAVDSVLAQTSPVTKVLVVDNGITPLIQRFDDHRVEVIHTEPRIGPSRSRNIGAEKASTQYVAFLDDDDFWLPDYMEHTLKAFAEDRAVSVVVGALRRLGRNGRAKPYKLFPQNAEGQRAVYYCNPGFGGQNFAIKRQIFLMVGGFDASLPASVDRDLAARLLQIGAKIAVAEKSVAVLCHHEGDRVRGNQVRGNGLFIAKHWRYMRWSERLKASQTYLSRWWRYTVLGRKPM
jgi:GT2 family glycosyltransferase